mmetsp:Transcript_46610/g.113548  ORF Transcript_46610/g.113548 Transcript_46610/m.113548 type:complete len:611 (-) Transcript_46610:285-2117(-)
MCITNFVRRARPVAVADESNNKSAAAATISSRPSLITQRLYNNGNGTVGGGNIGDANSSNCSGNSSSNSRGGVKIQAVSLDTLASLPHLLKTNHHQQQFQQQQQLRHNPNVLHSNGFGLGLGHGAESATATATAKKARRKRKPQKPGLTAKNNERHFVQHHYHDHAMDDDDVILDESHHEDDDHHNDGAVAVESSESANTTDDPLQQQKKKRRGGVSISFPMKLHAVLERMDTDGYSSILSWQPHGRSFKIHKPREFTEYVMPHYFRQSKLTSFQRQLNLYGFSRLTKGADAGSYYHELFLRGRDGLAKRMKRTKVKGTKYKAASNPDAEPDFYKMPPVMASAGTTTHALSPQKAPSHVSDDSSSEGNGSSSCNGDTDHYFDSPSSSRAVMPYQQIHQQVTPQVHSSGTATLMPSAGPVTTLNSNNGVANMHVMSNTGKEDLEPIDFCSFNSSQFDPLPLQQSSNHHQSNPTPMSSANTAAFPNNGTSSNNNMATTMMANNAFQMSMGSQSSMMFNPSGFGSSHSGSVMFSNFQAQSQGNLHAPPAKDVSAPVPACSTVDQVLDAAIDEIFSPENGTSMDDVLELDSLFNATSQTVQGDEQLGLLLDRFL